MNNIEKIIKEEKMINPFLYFRTFVDCEGVEHLVTRFEIELDDGHLGTGNYIINLYGKDEEEEYIVDSEEVLNMSEVINYLKCMGRKKSITEES